MKKYLHGVDLSYANNYINDTKAFCEGVDFAILRAGYGHNNFDSKLYSYLAVLMYRIPLSFYWFSYAYNEKLAAEEGEFLRNVLKEINYPNNLPVFWDYEYDSTKYYKTMTGKDDNPEIVRSMFEAFREPLVNAGYEVGLYYNMDYYRKYWKEWKDLENYPVWLAYYNELSGHENFTILQYTNVGSTPGVNGKIDLDIMLKNHCNYNLKDENPYCEELGIWLKYYNKWRYIAKNGKWAKSKWVPDMKAQWYYLDEDGWMVENGIREIDGKKYAFAEDGHMLRTNADGSLE